MGRGERGRGGRSHSRKKDEDADMKTGKKGNTDERLDRIEGREERNDETDMMDGLNKKIYIVTVRRKRWDGKETRNENSKIKEK